MYTSNKAVCVACEAGWVGEGEDILRKKEGKEIKKEDDDDLG